LKFFLLAHRTNYRECQHLDRSKHLGEVDMSIVTAEERAFDTVEESQQQRIASRPALAQCFNLHDFESVAKQVMKKTAWA